MSLAVERWARTLIPPSDIFELFLIFVHPKEYEIPSTRQKDIKIILFYREMSNFFKVSRTHQVFNIHS